MKFCRNCGGELAKDVKFCKHCGFDLTSQSETKDQQQSEEGEQKGLYTNQTVNGQNEQPKTGQTTSSQPAPPKQSPQMSNQTKIIAGIIGALIIFLFIGYKVADTMTSYERKIDNFETAIHENDHDALASILTSNNNSLEINEEAVGGLIEYYSEYPSEMNDLVRHLRAQGNAYDDDPEVMIYDSDYYPINLVRDGKLLFFFDRFDIQVSPVYFNVYTNYENTEILMDGEVIGTATSDDYSREFGPFLPGTYTFSARYTSDYVDLDTEATYTNYNPGYVSEVNLYIEANEVSFDIPYAQGYDEVKLLINGEDTGLNLVEADTVGPLPIDGSIEVAFEGAFPWGTVTTDPIPLDNNYIYVEFPVSDELKQIAQDKIIRYNQEYLEAYTQVDESVFTVASVNLIDEVIDDAEYEREWGRDYSGKFIGVDFYEEAYELDYYTDQQNWYLYVSTDTIYEETTYSFFGSSDFRENREDLGYSLVYDKDSGDWIVDEVGYVGYLPKETVIEYREEDPQTYDGIWNEDEASDDEEDEE